MNDPRWDQQKNCLVEPSQNCWHTEMWANKTVVSDAWSSEYSRIGNWYTDTISLCLPFLLCKIGVMVCLSHRNSILRVWYSFHHCYSSFSLVQSTQNCPDPSKSVPATWEAQRTAVMEMTSLSHSGPKPTGQTEPVHELDSKNTQKYLVACDQGRLCWGRMGSLAQRSWGAVRSRITRRGTGQWDGCVLMLMTLCLQSGVA